MPALWIQPPGVPHERQVQTSQRHRPNENSARCNKTYERFVFTQVRLETKIVCPQKGKSENTRQHTDTRDASQRAVLSKELSEECWRKQHKTNEYMYQNQEESTHAKCLTGAQPSLWHWHAQIFGWA